MSTENLENESVQWYKYRNDRWTNLTPHSESENKPSQPEAIFGQRNKTAARSLRASYIVFVV